LLAYVYYSTGSTDKTVEAAGNDLVDKQITWGDGTTERISIDQYGNYTLMGNEESPVNGYFYSSIT